MTNDRDADLREDERGLSRSDIEFLHGQRRQRAEYQEIRKNVIAGVASGLVLSAFAAIYGAVKWFLVFIIQVTHKPL